MARRQYIVDGKTQFRVAGLLVCGLAVLALVQTVALFTGFQPPVDGQFDGPHVRALLLRVGLVQFGVTALLALALGILLSHRFVGAALVLRRAIQGMRNGDSSQRLTLRRTDFLHDLSADILELRTHQAQGRETLAGTLARAERALEAGDLAQTQAELTLARRSLAPAASPATPPAVPAPRAEALSVR
jgi:hypothetical protein